MLRSLKRCWCSFASSLVYTVVATCIASRSIPVVAKVLAGFWSVVVGSWSVVAGFLLVVIKFWSVVAI